MQHIINFFIHDHRFWQKIKLSELGELYISMMLKSLALSLIGVFVPIYLYQSGFSITEIGIFYVYYWAFRIPLNYMAGLLIVKFGPKHVLTMSYLMLFVVLVQLLTLPQFGWSLIFLAVIQAIYYSLFYIAYHVDFSKAAHIKVVGKELSTMNIIVRIAASAGPFIGGAVATYFGMQYTIMMALVLLIFAIWPLMLTKESQNIKQKMDINSFSIKQNLRNIISYSALSIERKIAVILWPLFISIFIFVDGVYVKVGFVTSVSVGFAIVASRLYGKLVDSKKGKMLMNSSLCLSAIVHSLRVFAQNMGSVVLVNLTSEIGSTGVVLPFTKGFYAEAENVKDRVAYITMMEIIITLVRGVFSFVIVVLMLTLSEKTALVWSFYIAGICSLLVMVHKFKYLNE